MISLMVQVEVVANSVVQSIGWVENARFVSIVVSKAVVAGFTVRFPQVIENIVLT